MKATSLILTAVLMTAIAWIPAATQDRQALFEKALALEEAQGKLQEAIALYQKIVDESKDQALAAQAQLRIGICHVKLGHKEAQIAFQKVIDNYPGQVETVRLAREQLSVLVRTQTLVEKGDKEYRVIRIHTNTGPGWLSPDGKSLVVTDRSMTNLRLRNIASGREFELLSDPKMIINCFWSPDSKLIAYFAGNGNISVVSADGGRPKTVVEIDTEMEKAGKVPFPMGWTSDSTKLIFQLFARQSHEGLYAIPASGGRWEEIYKFLDPQKAKERNERLTLSPDGKWIAYQSKQNGNYDIYVMPARGGEAVRITDDPTDESGPLWSYDGQWLAFRSSRTGESGIWVIRIAADGKPAGRPIQATREGQDPTWTRDGKIAYYTTTQIANVFAANADGSQEIPLTKLNTMNILPRWSPDGKTIAFTSNYGAQSNREAVWTVPSSGGDEKFLAATMVHAWSPDGKRIAFCNERSHVGAPALKATISIIPADGGEAREIMNYDGSVSYVDWSPDGRSMVFAYSRVKGGKNSIPDSREEGEDIFVIPVTGGEPKKVVRNDTKQVDLSSPRWSPDGRKIAYLWVNRAGTPETGNLSRICTIDVDGGEPKVVTNEMPRFWFCWSRDGKYIIFSKVTEDVNLYRVSADGGKPEKLNIQGRAPDVSPDGKKIAYYRSTEPRFEFWLAENFFPADKKQK